MNALKNTLPDWFVQPLRQFRRRLRGRDAEARNVSGFPPEAEPGPLVAEVFERIRELPGWFTVDDCAHFHLALSLQTALGIQGDLFEIGSYFGRSTAMMAYALQPGEKIVVCDAFELDIEDRYNEQPTPEQLLTTLRRVVPALNPAAVEIHACLSHDLKLHENRRFRFIHLDGGHSQEVVSADLVLCSEHLAAGGILVVDDYHNAQWPGVTLAVDAFLSRRHDLHVLADLNRHGAIGRKLYLFKDLSPAFRS